MRPFVYERAETAKAAFQAFPSDGTVRISVPTAAPVQYLAGGTTLLDLMKIDVMRPEVVVDINALERTRAGQIEPEQGGLRLGALTRMTAAAEHSMIRRDYPVISQSLQLAASQQLRNMASLGGNVLQRTRCSYFRDVTYAECNKRNPGSGCAALKGVNRMHAVLGTSDQCIATYPGDFAQALLALDATVEISGPKGTRTISFASLHRRPADGPDVETTLAPGEMIMSFMLPAGPWRRSLYLKIRDRKSYEFALASAAVALDIGDGIVRDARIALGGVATVPWRANEAELILKGKKLDSDTINAAAEAAFVGARPYEHNAFKVSLGKRTVARALQQAGKLEL